MTDEYQRIEFWTKPTKKEDICILGKDINKLSKEELDYLEIIDNYNKEVRKFYPKKDQIKF